MFKYVVSLVLTLAIEGAVVAVRSPKKEWITYVLLVNMVTNPIANVLYNGLKPLMSEVGNVLLIIAIETAVVWAETYLFYQYRGKKDRRKLRRYSFRRCLIYSLQLNVLSFFGGFVLIKLIYE
ncbi:MAG: hypothetical protein K6G60_07875 [Lachnospiraceae bacterium]|nr:hypothetical protein [Lachnospiraceae bacterium]